MQVLLRSFTLLHNHHHCPPSEFLHPLKLKLCCCSVPHVWLCNSMHWNMPGFPVLPHLLEFVQTHVNWVGDAIQPSHPLVYFSFCLQYFHHGLFQWVGSSKLCTHWITISYFPWPLVITAAFSVSMNLFVLGTSYKWNHTLFVLFVWLISQSIMFSRFICCSRHQSIFLFFFSFLIDSIFRVVYDHRRS